MVYWSIKHFNRAKNHDNQNFNISSACTHIQENICRSKYGDVSAEPVAIFEPHESLETERWNRST